jgi:hypothetical protein
MNAVHQDVTSNAAGIAAVTGVSAVQLTLADYPFDVSDEDLDAVVTQISANPHTIFSMKQLNCRC